MNKNQQKRIVDRIVSGKTVIFTSGDEIRELDPVTTYKDVLEDNIHEIANMLNNEENPELFIRLKFIQQVNIEVQEAIDDFESDA